MVWTRNHKEFDCSAETREAGIKVKPLNDNVDFPPHRRYRNKNRFVGYYRDKTTSNSFFTKTKQRKIHQKTGTHKVCGMIVALINFPVE